MVGERNLWPRYAPDGVDPLDNTQISDFAPDASTFTARPQTHGGHWLSSSAGHEPLDGTLADLVGDGGVATRQVSAFNADLW